MNDGFPRRGLSVTAAEIAAAVGGTVVGDATRRVNGLRGLAEADAEDLSYLVDARRPDTSLSTRAGVVLVPIDLADTPPPSCTFIRVKLPAVAWARAATVLALDAAPGTPGVHATAILGARCRIGDAPRIGPFAVLGDDVTVGDRCVVGAGAVLDEGVTLGDDVWIGPRAVVYAGTRVGHRVIVHAGAVLGSEGFGFVRDGDAHRKIPQRGELLIEDDVEVGANTTIDRGSSGPTRVGRGTKIDNLVQVGHNVQIGRRCLLAGQAGIAGSSVLEDDVTLAGQAGVADHVRIGAGAIAAAQAGITGDVDPGTIVSGYPALPHPLARRIYAVRKRLPELLQRVAALEDAVRRVSKTSSTE